jgi:uncharacterized membrane protein
LKAAEVLASRVLFFGGVFSVALMTLGMVGFAVRGGLEPEFIAESHRVEMGAARSPAVFVSVTEVARGLGRWPVDPLAVVASGVLLLLVTPAISVASVLVVFLRGGDRRYAFVAVVLLSALLVSLVLVGGR